MGTEDQKIGNNKGAIDALTEIVRDRAAELHYDRFQDTVMKRLETELQLISAQDTAEVYLAARTLSLAARQDRFPLCFRSSLTGSLVSFLADISYINPLPPHYRCKSCGRIDFVDTDRDKVFCGVDLPDRICPDCGSPMKKDGYDIPAEAVFGEDGAADPVMSFETVDAFLTSRMPSCFRKVSDNIFSAADVRDPGKNQNRTASNADSDPILNEVEAGIYRELGCTDPRLHEMRFAVETDSGRKISAYGITNLTLELLFRTSEITKVEPRGDFFQTRKVMSVFGASDPGKDSVDPSGLVRGTLGVPLYGSRQMAELLGTIRPERFSDLIRMTGLILSSGAWEENAEYLVGEGIADLTEIACSREDVFQFLVKYGVEKHRAAEAARFIWNAAPLPEGIRQQLENSGVPEWFIESTESIRHLAPRAGLIYHNGMAWQAAWYKLHYPLEYYRSLFDVFATEEEKDEIRKGRNHVEELSEEYDPAAAGDLGRETLPWYPLLRAAMDMYRRGGYYH